MPRANRHFLPGYVWHITHRCHRKSFLLKFARDRRAYLHWVLEAGNALSSGCPAVSRGFPDLVRLSGSASLKRNADGASQWRRGAAMKRLCKF